MLVIFSKLPLTANERVKYTKSTFCKIACNIIAENFEFHFDLHSNLPLTLGERETSEYNKKIFSFHAAWWPYLKFDFAHIFPTSVMTNE